MNYIGCDCHIASLDCAVVNERGQETKKERMNTGVKELMKIVASVGLGQNFSALKSLVTTGIQKGHMKLHLPNIMTQLEANESEKVKIAEHFIKKTVSYSEVKKVLEEIRNK